MTTFQDYMRDKHARIYIGSDDDMSDAFDEWINNQIDYDYLTECFDNYHANLSSSDKISFALSLL